MVMNLWRRAVVGFELDLMFLNAQLTRDTTVMVNVNCQCHRIYNPSGNGLKRAYMGFP